MRTFNKFGAMCAAMFTLITSSTYATLADLGGGLVYDDTRFQGRFGRPDTKAFAGRSD